MHSRAGAWSHRHAARSGPDRHMMEVLGQARARIWKRK